MADTRVEGMTTMSEVPIVWDYPDVFLEDLLRMLPERKVKFRIDLVPGEAPIAKAPYRLAPPKMHELFV